MRNMSFALTSEQILNKTKTVTRRARWFFLKPGDLIQPVEKCMGLKKGEKVARLGVPIRILRLSSQLLNLITKEDVICEGFPNLTPAEFVEMFCRNMNYKPNHYITRIEFEYTGQSDISERPHVVKSSTGHIPDRTEGGP